MNTKFFFVIHFGINTKLHTIYYQMSIIHCQFVQQTINKLEFLQDKTETKI